MGVVQYVAKRIGIYLCVLLIGLTITSLLPRFMPANPIEAYMFGVMWSEHCGYKHSRKSLRRLPMRSSRVVSGPGENAGVVAVDEEWALAFKMESHNHPSAVDPYNGAATGVGGIIRDILAMGARPIALLDSLHVPAAVWMFSRGLPVKYTGPAMNAAQGAVAIEALEIAHEGVFQLPFIGVASGVAGAIKGSSGSSLRRPR